MSLSCIGNPWYFHEIIMNRCTLEIYKYHCFQQAMRKIGRLVVCPRFEIGKFVLVQRKYSQRGISEASCTSNVLMGLFPVLLLLAVEKNRWVYCPMFAQICVHGFYFAENFSPVLMHCSRRISMRMYASAIFHGLQYETCLRPWHIFPGAETIAFPMRHQQDCLRLFTKSVALYIL